MQSEQRANVLTGVATVLYILIGFGSVALFLAFLINPQWAAAFVITKLFLLGWVSLAGMFGAALLGVLPFARMAAGFILLVCNALFYFSLWAWATGLVILAIGRLWAVVATVFLFHVGMVPLAAVIMLFKAQWSVLLQLVVALILVVIFRFLAHYYVESALDRAKRRAVAYLTEAAAWAETAKADVQASIRQHETDRAKADQERA